MKIFVGFDDTDTLDCGRGTGKLARWFAGKLPGDCISLGVVRQQLLFSENIPMTSHNSSLCVIVEAPERSYVASLTEIAIRHISENFVVGSDPGLCVASEGDICLPELAEFGLRCTYMHVRKEDAAEAAGDSHLSEHGGTGMGIIGAAAAVGLTWKGDSGRFVEYKGIRELDEITRVDVLTDMGITVFSVNRHGEIPAPADLVNNSGSLRPRLFAGRVVLPVISAGDNIWSTINEKTEYRK